MVSKSKLKEKIICVVGLGYVGLPLALEFSKYFSVIGFDINNEKICNLKKNLVNINLTSDSSQIKKADYIIIAVPTPINKSKEPDLSFVESASKIVGRNLKKGATIVLESTVYPGVTEDIVGPIIEKESGFKKIIDFKLGYSPERINPGDKDHTINKINKIVAGINKDTTEELAKIYGKITRVYKISNIKIAEAAKVIENIQRDLNIALMNELAIIFHMMDLDTKAILDAASSKWNFHRYNPGLVGGHCIPVDPYYLVYKAKEVGYDPQVILAGRAINDYTPKYVGMMAIEGLNKVGKVIKDSKILIMGLTYKQNVSDTRESPVKTLIKELRKFGSSLYAYDPLLSTEKILEFEVKNYDDSNIKYDCIIFTVAHEEFKKMKFEEIKKIMKNNPVLIDVTGLFNKNMAIKNGFYYQTL